jgi:hypothetical protein
VSDDNPTVARGEIVPLVSPSPSTAPAAPPKRKLTGRPFPKGVSGNPGGRPKADLEKVRKAARAAGVEAIEKLISLMRTGSDKVAYLAAEAILARGFGRPAQTLEMEGGKMAAMSGVIVLPPTESEEK